MRLETVIHPDIGDIYAKNNSRTDERTYMIFLGQKGGMFYFHKIDNIISGKVLADYEKDVDSYTQSELNDEFNSDYLLFVCNVDKNGMSNAMANVIDYYKRYKGLEE